MRALIRMHHSPNLLDCFDSPTVNCLEAFMSSTFLWELALKEVSARRILKCISDTAVESIRKRYIS